MATSNKAKNGHSCEGTNHCCTNSIFSAESYQEHLSTYETSLHTLKINFLLIAIWLLLSGVLSKQNCGRDWCYRDQDGVKALKVDGEQYWEAPINFRSSRGNAHYILEHQTRLKNVSMSNDESCSAQICSQIIGLIDPWNTYLQIWPIDSSLLYYLPSMMISPLYTTYYWYHHKNEYPFEFDFVNYPFTFPCHDLDFFKHLPSPCFIISFSYHNIYLPQDSPSPQPILASTFTASSPNNIIHDPQLSMTPTIHFIPPTLHLY